MRIIQLFSLLFWGVAAVFGHGLIEDPPARSWICGAETKPDEVDLGTAETPACSTAFAVDPMAAYNYMAVLTHTLGRAEVNPLPENVCSFDSESWDGDPTPWDVPMDWPATPLSAGPQTFTWNITWGPHYDDTFEFRYWITRSDFVFSPSEPLTWEDFETEAFCIQEYDDDNPDANPNVRTDKPNNLFMTDCVLPERNGHHVIYGEWGRTPPTYERFHSCVDATFETSGTESRKTPGQGPTLSNPSGKQTDIMGRTRQRQSGRMILIPRQK